MTATSCTLCAHALGKYPTVDGDHAFCCHGCHAIYGILSVKGQLDSFKENPVFLQAAQAGLISNPALLEEIRKSKETIDNEEKEKLHLEIGEMWCPSCAEVIRLMLMREKGVFRCVVDYCTDLASIEFSPRFIGKKEIFSIISNLGYLPAELLSKERKAISRSLYLRFGIAAFFSLNIMMFSYPIYATYFDSDPQGYGHLFAWISFFFSLPVLTYCAWPIWKRFWTSLLVGLMGMEGLVVIGVSAAFLLSVRELLYGGNHVYFDSMSVVIVLVLLGKIIESKAKFSAKESIIRLSRSLPKRGRILYENGTEEFVSIKEINPGDLLVALAGEKVVLDGEVVKGIGTCDESLMTGEALPVKKEPKKPMLAGTIVQQGRLVYRVSKTAEETALHKIVEMVEKDIGTKTVYVRTADLVVRWFVPLVVMVAAFTALGCWLFGVTTSDEAILRAVSVLLISCPCAIGIAAPLAESHLMQALASSGAIVRNRGCLTDLGRETTFIFDKTGTVTEGKFRVHSGLAKLSEVQKRRLKGLSAHSTHPISQAIVQAIEGDVLSFDYVQELIGLGLVGDNQYWLGSQSLAKQKGSSPAEIETSETTVYFGFDTECLAVITLGDTVRQEAAEVVRGLFPTKTVLLSGDSEKPVKKIAQTCGFTSFKWGQNPLQKRETLEEMRLAGETVAMIGDGINDAPALTGAHVGISVVNATDVSIQVSDILLTTDDLSVIPAIRSIARKGQRIVRQNLFWAFFYNGIGILLAILGVLTPLFAALAMVLSSFIVVLNAKRL